jgi:hypothetical protein
LFITNDNINHYDSVLNQLIFWSTSNDYLIVISFVQTSQLTRYLRDVFRIQSNLTKSFRFFTFLSQLFFFFWIYIIHSSQHHFTMIVLSFILDDFEKIIFVINYLLMISWIYLLLSRIKISRSIHYQDCILHKLTFRAWLSHTAIFSHRL